jgi:Cu+-exporting ATPase
MASDGTTDPICGKPVDPLRARAVGIFGGVTYYFCSQECKAKFQDPRAAKAEAAPPATVERRKPESSRPSPSPGGAMKGEPAPKVEKPKLEPAPLPPRELDLPDVDTSPTIEEPARDPDHVPKRRSSWTVILLLFLLGGAVLVFLLRR